MTIRLVLGSLLSALCINGPVMAQNRFDAVLEKLPTAKNASVIVVKADQTLVSSTSGVFLYDCSRGPCSWEARFRWASVAKQVTAVLVMQEVAKGRIELDAPVSRYLPNFTSANAGKVTVRQLLRHQSGLPNPDDTPPGAGGMASYYLPDYKGNRDPLTGYCAGKPKAEPGGNWSYNNCDYIVVGALLEKVTGKSWVKLVRQRIIKPLKLNSVTVGGTTLTQADMINTQSERSTEPEISLDAFGAAGGLYGSATDLIKFDRALMDGVLLDAKSRSEMWDGQPQLGFIALGQWVFEAPLNGCKAPIRIVERRGAIGNVQVRNFILPDQKIAAAVFIEDPNFDFGEIWQGAGFSHDLLSTAACS